MRRYIYTSQHIISQTTRRTVLSSVEKADKTECLPSAGWMNGYSIYCYNYSINVPFPGDTLISPTGDPSPDPPSTTPGSPPSTTPGSPPSSTSQTGSVTTINSPSDVPDSSTAGPSVGGTPAPQPNSKSSCRLFFFSG